MRTQFFDGRGITSTSANHVANMAKEYIQTLENKIENLSYVGEEVKISGDKFSTKLPTSKEDVKSLDTRIQKIAKATQLIAWLREAIKEKQNAVNEILPIEVWIEREQEVYPDMPSKEKTITEAEIIAGWDVNTCYYYSSPDKVSSNGTLTSNFNGYAFQHITISAPTLEVAQRWLREIRHRSIEVKSFVDGTVENRGKWWIWHMYDFNPPIDWVLLIGSDRRYSTYEEALETGIKKALEIILEKGE